MPDGSAPVHTQQEAGTISEPYMWRYTQGQPPQVEYDYKKLKIKLDSRGLAKRTGTLQFSDLEPLPRFSQITLLQCGAPNPHGIVKSFIGPASYLLGALAAWVSVHAAFAIYAFTPWFYLTPRPWTGKPARRPERTHGGRGKRAK